MEQKTGLVKAILKNDIDLKKIDDKIIDLIYLLQRSDLIQALKLRDRDHLIFQNPSILEWVLKRRDKNLQTYQKFRSSYFREDLKRENIPKLTIQKINSSLGYGLFAREDLPKDRYLGEYIGVVRAHRKKDRENPFLVSYPIRYRFFQKLIIDGSTHGNHTRFINHSTKPNAQMISIQYNQIPRMILITTQRISNGSQIMIDYGRLFWKQLKKKPDVF